MELLISPWLKFNGKVGNWMFLLVPSYFQTRFQRLGLGYAQDDGFAPALQDHGHQLVN
jgi:hypothetical protein